MTTVEPEKQCYLGS